MDHVRDVWVRGTTIVKQAGVAARKQWTMGRRPYSRREIDIIEDALRLTGALDDSQAGIIQTLATLLNVSYEPFELHQSYTMASPSLSFSLFYQDARPKTEGKCWTSISLYFVTPLHSLDFLRSVLRVASVALPRKKLSCSQLFLISLSFGNLKYGLQLKIYECLSKVKLRFLNVRVNKQRLYCVQK